MAAWCFTTSQSPATWRELTRYERAAFEDTARAIHDQIKRRSKR